jgi:hypothetical protein
MFQSIYIFFVKLFARPQRHDEAAVKQVFDKISKDIVTARNKLQLETIENMIEMFKEKYGVEHINMYIELRKQYCLRLDENNIL